MATEPSHQHKFLRLGLGNTDTEIFCVKQCDCNNRPTKTEEKKVGQEQQKMTQ